MTTPLERLQTGYYNSQPVSEANPGGFADGGHVMNFPAALDDIAVVVGGIVLDADAIATAGAKAEEAAQSAAAAAASEQAAADILIEAVTGPDGVAANRLVLFDGVSGKIIKEGPAITAFRAAGDIPQAEVTGLVADLAAKAHLASPAFTGNPTASTQTAGNSSTRLATTAFVSAAVTAIIGMSPSDLDTLAEIAARIQSGESNYAALVSVISGKLQKDQNLADLTSTGTALTNLGLSANGKSLVTEANYTAMRALLGVVIGTDVMAYDADLAAFAGLASAADKIGYFTDAGAMSVADFTVYGRSLAGATDQTILKPTESLIVAVSDEATAITTGAAKVTMRMPYAFTLTAVRASLTTASSSGIPTIDINEGGATILSTKLSIDATERTSTTAATAAVISDPNLADDAEITIDIDVAGTGAKGLKVALIGHRP